VYYVRKTNVDSFDFHNGLLVTWRGDVGFHVDFDIYSTLQDALNDQNAFQFCNGNDPGIGFPRDCGPTGYIPYTWTSLSNGATRKHYEYSVYSKTDDTSYMWLHYGQHGHLSTDAIADFSADKCHNGEHTYSYGYNLCDCLDCPPLPYVPPAVCTAAKQCCASTGGQYDYSKHDIKMNCAATTVDFAGPSIKLSTGKMTSKPDAATFEDAVDNSIANALYGSKALETVDYSNGMTFGAGNRNIAYKLEVTFQVCEPGTWHFDFNVDFGWGGVVRFDGVRSPEGYHSGDHWWSHDLNRALPLDIGHHFDAGVHTMVVYGAEGCCDGRSNVRIQKPGAGFEQLSIASLACGSVDEE
jgi:hypothetical protein